MNHGPIDFDEDLKEEQGITPESNSLDKVRDPRMSIPFEIVIPKCNSTAPLIPMTQKAYRDAMDNLVSEDQERAGMLLGPVGEPIVTHFVLDKHGQGTRTSFTLHSVSLNQILKQSRACGLDSKGLAHLHPPGIISPSPGDIEYVRRSLSNSRNQTADVFLLPIVCNGRMYPYFIRRDEPTRVHLGRLLLI